MDSSSTLSEKDALDFVVWTLSDIARRPSSTTKHQKLPVRSHHMAMYPEPGYLRGSDLSERLYVCVKVLKRAGFTNRDACLEVAEKIYHILGRSRRGRPRKIKGERDLDSWAKAIAARVSAFGRRHQYVAGLVDYRIGNFLFLRKAEMVRGSEYTPDSGQKLHDFWLESIRKLPKLEISGDQFLS